MLVRFCADGGVFAFGVFFVAMPRGKGAITLVEVAKSKVDFWGVVDLGGETILLLIELLEGVVLLEQVL